MINKNLEERTASRLESIATLMECVNDSYEAHEDKDAIHNQTLAIYEQNQITIDYLQTIYNELKK